MNLKTTSLIISIIGISILLTLSLIMEPKLSTIKELNKKQTFERVKIQGQLTNEKSYNNGTFNILTIKDPTGEVEVLINKKINININQTLEIIGKITEYKNKVQITAEKIKIIK